MYVRREGFFAFLDDIGAQGDGFSLFGATHLTMLVLLGILIAALCFIYKKLNAKKRRFMLISVALAIFAMEAARQLTFPLLHGRYWAFLLPFHMCAISIFLEQIHAFYPNKTTGEILYSLGLPGAAAALLFANWSMYPVFNFYALQSFIIHALHIAFPLMLLITGELRPQLRNLWRPVMFIAAILPVLYLVNIWLGTNFLFVNAGSEGSPLEIFIDLVGVPWFLIPYTGLLGLIWFFMYLPWFLAGRYPPERQNK